MSVLALLRTAWFSIGSNKLRTGLTLLGMIIGVAAVISLMAIGRGSHLSRGRRARDIDQRPDRRRRCQHVRQHPWRHQ
jgi:multisubunit Na+/H+ antiporter MnhG subunit